ncbi:MAG: hypothetical protein JNL02_13640 [Saprospiraceae bacterium]|nr:hypothetical protein [Saprospiraceae bacterium]
MPLKQFYAHSIAFVLYVAIAFGMFLLSGIRREHPEQERTRQLLLGASMRSNAAEMAANNSILTYRILRLADIYFTKESVDLARRSKQANSSADLTVTYVQFHLSAPHCNSAAFHLDLVCDSLKRFAYSLTWLAREDPIAASQIHSLLDLSELSTVFRHVSPLDTARWSLLSADLTWRIHTATCFTQKVLDALSKKLEPGQEITRTPILVLEKDNYPFVGQPFEAALRLVSQHKNDSLFLSGVKGIRKDGVYYWTERKNAPGFLTIRNRSALKSEFGIEFNYNNNFSIPVFKP